MSGPRDIVVEVRLDPATTDEAVLALMDELVAVGAEELEVADQAVPPRAWALLRLDPEQEAAALRRLASRAEVASVRTGAPPQSDWNSVRQLGLRPVVVGPLCVVPPGLPPAPGAEHVLVIDSGAAFGTGLHASTKLVLEWLVERDPVAEVLDFGTGTGILGLAALRLGHGRVGAVEDDDVARRVAAENARENGLLDRFDLHPELPEKQYPVVLANVLAAPLEALAAQLVRHVAPGGALVLSGIQAHQAEPVIRAYRNLGMWWVGQGEDDGWLRVELRPSW